MDSEKVKSIYLDKKDKLLKGIVSQEKPIAFILGGQPASGKSGLAKAILRQFPDKDFLFVNGDIYREFHPEAGELIKYPERYSAETQIFSNFFTEALIQEAITYKYNIIVEGTMRNPEVPLRTALAFRENGFGTEAFAIAAPALFTELGFYLRYQEEIDFQGYGRLADKSSHDKAVEGLLCSLDHLYTEKAVDKIHLYSYQAEKHLVTFILNKEEWDINILPSVEVIKTREKQYQDKELRLQLIERANAATPRMVPSIKTIVEALVQRIKD
ncbi:zeta toxin family protein [Capnocytophaga leadbetteri]|uniref:zeta toxin family protein n=1 Tax=Capnocytophaga leadbetteri TaxID=327575 RepID=UPI0026F00B67|nr:zeta toxin family protein [Capnocytophaga leadbetteri]